ncbi:MAG: OmpH family outer membrane protein, partial [Candidatus Omnitrophica bacterium]|nr:OmpH family outer membrane protein [Candidatus Omnitrophota bacterium]
AASTPAVAQGLEKIGYVDLSRLFDEYYKTKDYDKVLEQKHKTFEEERQVKVDKIQESIGKLGLLADDKKADLESNIEEMKAEVLEYDRQKRTDLTKERNEKIREILLEIEKVVSDYAQKEKYSVILNDRVLIYGNQTFDLTEEILKVLNKK